MAGQPHPGPRKPHKRGVLNGFAQWPETVVDRANVSGPGQTLAGLKTLLRFRPEKSRACGISRDFHRPIQNTQRLLSQPDHFTNVYTNRLFVNALVIVLAQNENVPFVQSENVTVQLTRDIALMGVERRQIKMAFHPSHTCFEITDQVAVANADE